jgi:hypothetical protein
MPYLADCSSWWNGRPPPKGQVRKGLDYPGKQEGFSFHSPEPGGSGSWQRGFSFEGMCQPPNRRPLTSLRRPELSARKPTKLTTQRGYEHRLFLTKSLLLGHCWLLFHTISLSYQGFV